MGLNLGNTNIGEIYLGNTKIAEAYLGSTKVYSLPVPAGYDSYRIKVEWTQTGTAYQMFFQGVNINGVAATSSQFSGGSYYNWYVWIPLNPDAVINWNQGNSYQFEILYLDIIEPNVTSIDVHIGTWWAGDYQPATVSLIGVKDGVETVLGSDTESNTADLTYSVSI